MPAQSRDHIRLVHPGGTLQAPDPKNSTDRDNALRSTVIEDFSIELRQHRTSEPRGGSSSRRSGASSAQRAFSKHPGGVLHFDALVAGDLRFAVEAPGYPVRLIDVAQLAVGETRTLEVAMQVGIKVLGIVRTLDGTPIANARLAVKPVTPEPEDASITRAVPQQMRMTSDSEGRFEFKNLDPGSWICEAALPIKKLNLTRVSHPAFLPPEQQERQQSYAPFSVQGVASHTRLFAGRKCCFALAANGTWAHIFTRDLELRSGSTHNVEATLVFHDGSLNVIAPDGTPGANLLLNLAPIFEPPLAEASYGGELKLDAGGVAQVRLPPGRYRISTRLSRTELSRSAAEFNWPPTDLLQVHLQR